jgi:DnaJ-domain-containing protein 1
VGVVGRRAKRENEALREFISQTTLRIETVGREIVREMRAHREQMRAQLGSQREEIRGLREESRAQTRALLRILDRLENGGAAAG